MTLHLLPVPPKYNHALMQRRKSIHAQLANELAEEKISRELTDRHNERLRRSAEYRQNGGSL